MRQKKRTMRMKTMTSNIIAALFVGLGTFGCTFIVICCLLAAGRKDEENDRQANDSGTEKKV